MVDSEAPRSEQTAWVNSHRVDRDFFLLQFSEELGTRWDTLHCHIEGLDYQPGTLYKLRLSEEESQGALKSYQVLEVLEERIDEKLRLYDIWALVAMPDYLDMDTLDARAYIELNTSDMTIRGQAHCNHLSGRIAEADGHALRFDQMIQTQMACEMLAEEDEFMQRLANTRSYEREGLRLILQDAEGMALLLFNKVD